MVRSYWKGALVLTLTWVGAATAQQPPSNSPRPGQPSERIMTVQEPGEPALPCRVLSATPLAGGGTAYKVQSLATGETSTIVDGSGGASLVGTVLPASSQKYLGPVEGPRQAPPPGGAAPLKPQPVTPGVPAQGSACGDCSGCDCCGCDPCGACAACEIRTVQETGRPLMRCRLLRRWRMTPTCYACQMQCVENGEMMTIVEDGPVTPVPGAAGGRVRAIASRIFHWGRYSSPPPGAPSPPPEGIPATAVAGPVRGGFQVSPTPVIVEGAPFPPGMQKEVVLAQPAPAQPGLFSRLAGKIQSLFTCKSPAAQPAPPAQVPQAPATVAQAPAPQPPVKTAQAPPAVPPPVQSPTDFRRSWDEPLARADAPKPAPVAPLPVPPPPSPPVAQAPPRPPLPTPTPPLSQADRGGSKDLLLNPDRFASRAVEQKVPGFRSGDAPPRAEPRPTPPAPGATLSNPMPTTANLSAQGKVPLGVQSVLAASNGLERPVQYVPVPIVTMPEPRRPPLPPLPQIPQAPQPNNKEYLNAFSPPPMPQNAQPGGQGYLPPPGPMAGPQAMAPGSYPPMMARYPASGYYPTPQGPMPMYGYNPMAQGAYPPGPYGMPQPMYPYPYGPMAMPQAPGRGTVPYTYQGPQPPNPFAAPMPYGYGRAPVAQNWGNPRNVAMDRPAVAAGMDPNQWAANNQILEMLNVLKTSTYPSQREWAANNLASLGWRSHPAVLPALLSAAREDPAPTVRSGCVYNLSRIGAPAEPVLAALRQLKTDSDPRVRVEAERALTRLSIASRPSTPAEPNAVQPARATAP